METEGTETGVQSRSRSRSRRYSGERSVVKGQDGWRVASAYKGLRPFGAAFAWISERGRRDLEDESEVQVREMYTE